MVGWLTDCKAPLPLRQQRVESEHMYNNLPGITHSCPVGGNIIFDSATPIWQTNSDQQLQGGGDLQQHGETQSPHSKLLDQVGWQW